MWNNGKGIWPTQKFGPYFVTILPIKLSLDIFLMEGDYFRHKDSWKENNNCFRKNAL